MVVVDATPSTPGLANVVQDLEWAFIVQCNFDFSLSDSCMSVAVLDVWYLDSGATKHITSQRNYFTSLEFVPIGNTVSYANNSSYLFKGFGQIVLTTVDGSTLPLSNPLYIPRIKKNFRSIFALVKIGLAVKFMDDR